MFLFAIRTIALITVLTLVLGGIGHVHAMTVTFSNPPINSSGGRLLDGDDNFTEDGMWVEGFWFNGGIGTPSPSQPSGHLHEATVNYEYEKQHYNGLDQLQGLYIERIDGGTFSLLSLDYSIRNTSSIVGFNSNDVNILITTSFDPTHTVASEFTGFSVGNIIGGPFQTLPISGFENVTSVFISSSASVNFDNINAVPEPGTLLLFGLGGLVLRRRK